MRVAKPLVIESFRKVIYNNTEYKRRLRISGYNALLIDSNLCSFSSSVFSSCAEN